MIAKTIRKHRGWRILFFAGCGLSAIAVSLLIGAGLWIHHDVAVIVHEAQAMHPGNRIEALAALAETNIAPLDQRNRAIWALGQLADSRALPALERLQTHQACDHAHQVCQYELEKAIGFCAGTRIQLFAKLLHGGETHP